jgi:hypothetical protein
VAVPQATSSISQGVSHTADGSEPEIQIRCREEQLKFSDLTPELQPDER